VDDHVLTVRGVSRSYGEVEALAPLDLDLPAGGGLVLLGHNGSGKSTALQCVAGLLTPTAGTVAVDGQDPHREPGAARARAALAFAGDTPVFYRDLTVAEHVELVAVGHRAGPGAAAAAVTDAGLDDRRDRLPQQLSAGLRQRAQLACALVRPARLLVLDEPTLRLDPEGRGWLRDRLRAARAGGMAVLLSTHDLTFAEAVADGAVLLDQGAVVARGAVRAVTAHPAAGRAAGA
jgi:ABC-2 type transport system ATP-binding protein